jgi:D-glycero-D-manno-heptose 1,7-bisphosphate phosphatase
MTRAGVFVDRDGVLNEPRLENGKPLPPRGVDELRILPGVQTALERLRAAGFPVVVVTNQPDIARRTVTIETVEAINRRLRDSLPVDDVIVCPHDDEDDCECRKPKPGMLLDAAKRHRLELARSYLVGDRWRDIEAGRRAGVTTVFIDRGYDERRPERPDATVRDLAEAAEWILDHHG